MEESDVATAGACSLMCPWLCECMRAGADEAKGRLNQRCSYTWNTSDCPAPTTSASATWNRIRYWSVVAGARAGLVASGRKGVHQLANALELLAALQQLLLERLLP